MEVYRVHSVVAVDYLPHRDTGFLEPAMKIRWIIKTARGNMSYQTSWEFFDAQPELAEEPSVVRMLKQVENRPEGWTVTVVAASRSAESRALSFHIDFDGFSPDSRVWWSYAATPKAAVLEYMAKAIEATEHKWKGAMVITWAMNVEETEKERTYKLVDLPSCLFDRPSRLLKVQQKWGSKHGLLQYEKEVQR